MLKIHLASSLLPKLAKLKDTQAPKTFPRLWGKGNHHASVGCLDFLNQIVVRQTRLNFAVTVYAS